MGDTQCTEVTILDNSVLDGERNFSIRLVEVRDNDSGPGGNGGNDQGGNGAQIDPNSPSINIRIALDVRDGKSHHIIL